MNNPASPPARFRDRPWLVACAVLVLVKLWLVAAQPVIAIGTASHDDRLFLHLADKILAGEWLGPYRQLTLAKGPMYPLWIAGTFLLGLPLPLAQHLLYLAGCILVIRALRPHLPTERIACVVFLLLWWNPMTYEMPVLGRVLRQNLYTPATLLFFAALIALETRRGARRGIRVAWGILLGVSGATLWLTREESIWIVPSTILLVSAAAWNSWRAGERLKPLIAPLVAAIANAAVIVMTVCTINFIGYGWFGTVEFRAPEFVRAYGALQRVKSSYEIPYVPVTREAREKAYAVSPTFAELRPHLEGNLGTAWARSCESVTHRPQEDREIAGGWFMWALRDAVAYAGHATSARSALDFYARIADEVNRACDDGRLPAYPRRDTFVPRWQPEYTSRLIVALPQALNYFMTFQDFTAMPTQSIGTAMQLRLFRDLTRWPVAPSPDAPELDRHKQQQLDYWRIFLLENIGRGLRWICSAAAYGGLVAWLWLLVRACRQRELSYRFVAGTASLGGAAAVVVINTLVDVMSFPNRSPGAFAQAYPLLLLFAGLILTELWISHRRT